MPAPSHTGSCASASEAALQTLRTKLSEKETALSFTLRSISKLEFQERKDARRLAAHHENLEADAAHRRRAVEKQLEKDIEALRARAYAEKADIDSRMRADCAITKSAYDVQRARTAGHLVRARKEATAFKGECDKLKLEGWGLHERAERERVASARSSIAVSEEVMRVLMQVQKSSGSKEGAFYQALFMKLEVDHCSGPARAQQW